MTALLQRLMLSTLRQTLTRPMSLQGTFYGKGQDDQGACGFSSSAANSLNLPWTSGTTLTVAIDDFQYADGLSCGMCLKFRGVGTGIGTTPVPQTWQYALVNNRYVWLTATESQQNRRLVSLEPHGLHACPSARWLPLQCVFKRHRHPAMTIAAGKLGIVGLVESMCNAHMAEYLPAQVFA